LSRLLRDNMFAPISTQAALFVPPARSRMVLASARAWEKVGARVLTTFGGVLMIEAGKQIYAAGVARDSKRRRHSYAHLPPAAPAASGG
jgi:hypothetical protein